MYVCVTGSVFVWLSMFAVVCGCCVVCEFAWFCACSAVKLFVLSHACLLGWLGLCHVSCVRVVVCVGVGWL